MSDVYKKEVVEKAKQINALANAAVDEIVNITKNHQGTDEDLRSKILRILGEYGQEHFKIASV